MGGKHRAVERLWQVTQYSRGKARNKAQISWSLLECFTAARLILSQLLACLEKPLDGVCLSFPKCTVMMVLMMMHPFPPPSAPQ